MSVRIGRQAIIPLLDKKRPFDWAVAGLVGPFTSWDAFPEETARRDRWARFYHKHSRRDLPATYLAALKEVYRDA